MGFLRFKPRQGHRLQINLPLLGFQAHRAGEHGDGDDGFGGVGRHFVAFLQVELHDLLVGILRNHAAYGLVWV